MEKEEKGKEYLAEKEKGKTGRSRNVTKRDNKGAGTSEEKREMEEEEDQRER